MLRDTLGKEGAYDIIEGEAASARFRHGDAVYIAGEPGMRYYRVIGSDATHGTVTVSDAGGATYRVPESSLRRA